MDRWASEYVFRLIKHYRDNLTKQQFKTLVGQIKAGDAAAALQGLNTILNKKNRDR